MDGDLNRASASAARRRAESGDFVGAIALATDALRIADDGRLMADLVGWRLKGFAAARHAPARDTWPPSLPDPFPGLAGIPEIAASGLTADILGGAILHHGCLKVAGLVPADRAEQLRLGVERALAARDAYHAAAEAGGADPAALADPGWYVPADVPELADDRPWVENGGAVWTSDTPPMLSALIDTFGQSGVIDHIEQFMGERPGLSVGKSTLRRVPITSGTDWHQDGAFLGRDVRSVNVWLALSDCGVDASGLDVVAQRLPYVVQTGSHGAWFDWSVGQGMVDVLAEGGAPVVSPAFKAGDALLFDHLLLHRTGITPSMTKSRWAVESWFFAPSFYPMKQVPLLV